MKLSSFFVSLFISTVLFGQVPGESGAHDASWTSPTVSDTGPKSDASFIRGVQLFEAQKFDEAEPLLQSTLPNEYALYFLAEIDLQKKRPSEAVEKCERALRTKPTGVFARDLTFLQAEAELARNKKDRSLQIAERLLKKNKRFRPLLDFLATNGKSEGKKCEIQIRIWKLDPAYELPIQPHACTPTFADIKERIRKFQALGQGQIAFEGLKKQWGKKFQANEWTELSAQIFMADGELEEAARVLEPLKDESFSSALALGIIDGRRGETEKALAIFQKLDQKKLSDKQRSQLIFQRAFLSYQVRNYELAAEQLQKYQRYGRHREARELSAWYTAWIDYLRGQYVDAKKAFLKMSQGPRWNVQALYWLAMTHYRLGENLEAKRIFDLLAASESVPGYYRVLASQRGQALRESLGQTNYIFATGETLAPKFQPYLIVPNPDFETVQLFEREEEPALSIAETPSESDPETAATATTEEKDVPVSLAKVRTLESAGLVDYAQAELKRAKTDFKNSDLFLGELEKLGCYDVSTLMSRNLIAQGGRHGELDRFAYPQPFSDLVSSSAKQFKIAPQLIWSIMYAESRFQKDIVSPVGARGLMQLMPFTAEKVSELIGLKEFSPLALSEPSNAIRIGTRYLQKLDHEFDHQTPLMIAAYNAGPHRVQSWLYYLSSLEMDEFIEHIPYSETRGYVKKVLSYIDAYARIYKQPFEFTGLTTTAHLKSEKKLVLKESWTDSATNGL